VRWGCYFISALLDAHRFLSLRSGNFSLRQQVARPAAAERGEENNGKMTFLPSARDPQRLFFFFCSTAMRFFVV
jgi:hypothetical protein